LLPAAPVKPAEPARDAVPALIAASRQSVEQAIEAGIRSDLSGIILTGALFSNRSLYSL
jgi:hypothetical protein